MNKLLIALLVSWFTPHTQTLNLQQINKALESSVLIHSKVILTNPDTLETRKGMVGCSGIFIAPTTVLTAAHCFQEMAIGTWVRDYNHHSFEAKLIKINPSNDLALLAVVSKAPHKYTVLASSVSLGESVLNVGNPYSLEFLISEGVVASLGCKFKPYNATYLVTTAMINPGSSGGGAFNERGELIGINTMSVGSPFGWAGISLAVDIQTIKEFLK